MIKTNNNGTNIKIKAHILSDKEMKEIGFTDFAKDRWYYCKDLGKDISFNVTIPKDGGDIEIITLDENFCQPYDYQIILDHSPTHKLASMIRDKVEEQMDYLQSAGVLSGHNRGEYI